MNVAVRLAVGADRADIGVDLPAGDCSGFLRAQFACTSATNDSVLITICHAFSFSMNRL